MLMHQVISNNNFQANHLARVSLINLKCFLYLKFADLGVEGKGVEEHGADEGDVSGLAAHVYKWFLKGTRQQDFYL